MPRAVRSRLLGASLFALTATPALAQPASPYGRVVVFGDSISDGGAYADKAPAGAGSFTTNPDAVWVERVAEGLGLTLAPRAAGGTNYAEGGARVATPRPGAPGDLPRTPVDDQIDAFLAAGGSFRPDDLVILQGGGNDVFATQTNGPSFTPADLAVLDRASADLAGQAQRIAAAGGPTVVTTSVPRFEVLNVRYRAALADAGVNLLYVDVAGLVAEIEANPGEFGIVNVVDRACRGRALESFTCLPADYVVPDANRTYLFADNVHFTGVVHEIEADLTVAALRAPGQIGQLPLAGRAALQGATRGLKAQLGEGPDRGHWSLFGWAEAGAFDMDPSAGVRGLDGDLAGATVGAAYGLRPWLSVGGALGWSEGDGDFGPDLGGFEMRSITAQVFARADLGRLNMSLDAAYGDLDFDDVSREVKLGPARRTESGDTHGKMWSAGLEAGLTHAVGAFAVRPFAGLRYERVEAEAYAEAGELSSQITFGDQKTEQLLGSVGAEVSWNTQGRWAVEPFVRASYEVDLLDNTPKVSIQAHGAPVAFTSAPYALDGEYLAYAAGARVELQPGVSLAAEVAGTAGRRDSEATAVRFGLRGRF